MGFALERTGDHNQDTVYSTYLRQG